MTWLLPAASCTQPCCHTCRPACLASAMLVMISPMDNVPPCMQNEDPDLFGDPDLFVLIFGFVWTSTNTSHIWWWPDCGALPPQALGNLPDEV